MHFLHIIFFEAMRQDLRIQWNRNNNLQYNSNFKSSENRQLRIFIPISTFYLTNPLSLLKVHFRRLTSFLIEEFLWKRLISRIYYVSLGKYFIYSFKVFRMNGFPFLRVQCCEIPLEL